MGLILAAVVILIGCAAAFIAAMWIGYFVLAALSALGLAIAEMRGHDVYRP